MKVIWGRRQGKISENRKFLIDANTAGQANQPTGHMFLAQHGIAVFALTEHC
jgi:hypothetical protein